MRLILKIFLCYWIAACIVIAAADMGPHQQMHRQEVTSALKSLLRLQGSSLTAAYERGGCSAVNPMFAALGDQIYLARRDGNVLCRVSPVQDMGDLVATSAHSNAPVASYFHDFQLVSLAITSASGKPYLLFLKCKYTTPLERFGFAVGPTTIWISAGVTLLLGVLIAIPIRRVRSVARAVTNGRLDARVRLGWLYERIPRFGGEDVLLGLATDFNRMADRLEFLADAQRTLFRDISHELRSPLARLSVALELAREVGNCSMTAPLDRIEKETARVNDLVGQLLTLSHMETMHELNNQNELSLRDLIEYLMPDLEYEAVGRCRTVIVRTMHDCILNGDPVMLQRAFENVVRNAICYTPEQGIVEIDLRKVERDGVEVGILQIGDNGPGVPSDELQSILRPFYRSDKSRGPSTGGFGVGLAIANRAVNLHSGKIAIWNKPEGGLLVEMTFPLIKTVTERTHDHLGGGQAVIGLSEA